MNAVKRLFPYIIFFSIVVVVLYAENALFLNNQGRVGIGTNTPRSELDVNGRIYDKSGFVMPVGTILPYGGMDVPLGWLLCNGQAIDVPQDSSNSMWDLYGKIGVNFGSETGKFKLPDLRGMFLRGVNSGRTDEYKDPNLDARIPNGNMQKDAPGSIQTDETGSHQHQAKHATAVYSGSPSGTDIGTAYYNSISTFWGRSENDHTGWLGLSFTGLENRPNNIYVNYIIKY